VFLPIRDDAPRRRFPVVTVSLVVINVAVFVVARLLPTDKVVALFYGGGAIPYQIVHLNGALPAPVAIVTSLFLHGGPEHLVGNIWFLWIFGDNVEDALGRGRYLLFYLLLGFLAAAAQVATTPESHVPIVGASGAIAGVLGAYLVLFPRARVEALLFLVILVDIVIVPAFLLLGVWVLWQLIANTGDGSVAVWAHVGGFLAGAVLGKLFARRREPRGEPARSAPAWTLPIPASASSSSLP
jgi:rhomboid family protein